MSAGGGDIHEADLLRLVEVATSAPSSHNTQPWRFQISQSGVRLLADRTRALPHNDPEGRELTISCGAALFTLRVAAAQAGLTATVRVVPGPDPDLLADVAITEGGPAPHADLWGEIGRRRTWRGPFRDQPLPHGLVDDLTAACAAERAWLHVVADGQRHEAARLVAEGDRLQFRDRGWRRELAEWMRGRGSADGLVASTIARRMVRLLDVGPTTARTDARLAVTAPLLTVVGTDEDRPADWVAAGQGLQHLLLVAAAAGVQAGYLNQPCQVATLRPRLADHLQLDGAPQLLVRLGIPAGAARSTPRRPVEQVLID